MEIREFYSSAGGLQLLRREDHLDEIRSSLAASETKIERGSSSRLKRDVEHFLKERGWAINARIEIERGPTLNALHPAGIGLQVQIGNVARAFYDLLKLQALFNFDKIRVGVLVVPTSRSARILGGNLANFERVSSEHQSLFNSTITMPLAIIGFE